MNLIAQIRPAVVLMAVLTVLLGLAYPLAITGVAQVVFPFQSNGSLLYDAQGNVVGSALIGQSFASSGYFHPRPSAAGTNGYDATSSGGSNLGPTSQSLISSVRDRAVAYREENGLPADAPVPVDAVTASASGLDPDISPANALIQANRVAAARNLPVDQVVALVDQHTQGRVLGFLGEPRVNVLEINRALDALGGTRTG